MSEVILHGIEAAQRDLEVAQEKKLQEEVGRVHATLATCMICMEDCVAVCLWLMCTSKVLWAD